MSLNIAQREIIAELKSLEDEFDRFTYLTLMGNKLGLPHDSLRCDAHMVKGCQSETWVRVSLDHKHCVVFEGYSDTLIVRGLLYLLKVGIEGAAPLAFNLEECYAFYEEAGLLSLLTESRRNGLRSILTVISQEISRAEKTQ